ncbi:MAG TPA: glycosyltransferase, partial [Bacteroidales bacterium]|nr:glycosyltransferase [Bacteroidales bacterium]
MRKIRLYSRISAESHFYKGNKTYVLNLLINPAWRFFRDYIIKLGFIEGRDGLGICRISAYETYLKYKKLLELQRTNRRIKGDICFFNGNKTWGGGEKWYFDIASRLLALNYRVVAVANRNSELLLKFRLQKVPAFSIALSNLSFVNPLTILRLILFFKRAEVKTVIINLSSDLKVAGVAAKLAGVEKIIYRRGSAIPIKNTFLNRFIFKNIVTDVIANSEETRRTILKNNPNIFDQSKIRVIYNGIDLRDLNKSLSEPVYVPQKGEFIIGNCGRLSPEKGQHHLIELAKIFKDRGEKVKILIAGEGKLKDQLKSYARDKGVDDDVLFLGFINDLS